MRGRLVGLTFSPARTQLVTIEMTEDFRPTFDRLFGKDLDVEVRPHREIRSKLASAYFHVLCNKIAAERGTGDEETKRLLVTEYGALAQHPDGTTVVFAVPAGTDVSGTYPYIKWFDSITDAGAEKDCFLVYKPTHEMDTKEMSRLIDGAILEAKELGIETDTPEQLAKRKAYWEVMAKNE